MKLAETLAATRERKKLSQVELGRLARVAPAHIAQIETGKISNPGVKVMSQIARALGVSIDELLGEKRSAA